MELVSISDFLSNIYIIYPNKNVFFPQLKKIVQFLSPRISLCIVELKSPVYLKKHVIDIHDKESPAPNSLKTWTSALPMGENIATAYLFDSTFERKGKLTMQQK